MGNKYRKGEKDSNQKIKNHTKIIIKDGDSLYDRHAYSSL